MGRDSARSLKKMDNGLYAAKIVASTDQKGIGYFEGFKSQTSSVRSPVKFFYSIHSLKEIK
jgi:hypothetical protein